MYQHLFVRKKPCPDTNGLDLTNEIRDTVLKNKLFHFSKTQDLKAQDMKTTNQTINYNNTITNYVTNMDVLEKINKLIAYTKLPHIGYEDNIRIKYDDEADFLRHPKNLRVESVAMKPDDLMLIIDSVTKVSQGMSDAVEINVLYDNKAKKIRLFQDGVWDDTIISIGLKKLVQSIQENYLNDYEKYLVCKSRNIQTHFSTKALIKDLIKDYYRFIGAFELYPLVRDKPDSHFRLGSAGDFEVEEEFMPIYTQINNAMTKSEIKNVQKDVLDIIKGNSQRNIDELNKKVINLLQIDDTFKETMFNPKKPGALSYIDEVVAEMDAEENNKLYENSCSN